MRSWTRRLGAWLLLALLVVTTGCAASKLREAQDAFNQGAQLENSARYVGGVPAIDPRIPGSAPEGFGALTATAYYRRAVEALDAIGPRERRELERDRLWGGALTLQALANWRLGKWDAALQAALEARGHVETGTRDHLLVIAMPGLIKHDQAYAALAVSSPDTAKVRRLLVGDDHGALSDIRAARVEAAEHPIDTFLIQAELAVLKNLKDLERREHPNQAFSRIEEVKKLRRELCDDLAGDPNGERLVAIWMRALGATPTCAAAGGGG
jgi:hypothetical protein